MQRERTWPSQTKHKEADFKNLITHCALIVCTCDRCIIQVHLIAPSSMQQYTTIVMDIAKLVGKDSLVCIVKACENLKFQSNSSSTQKLQLRIWIHPQISPLPFSQVWANRSPTTYLHKRPYESNAERFIYSFAKHVIYCKIVREEHVLNPHNFQAHFSQFPLLKCWLFQKNPQFFLKNIKCWNFDPIKIMIY